MKEVEQEEQVVVGRGRGSVAGDFQITITNEMYTAILIAEMLRNEDIGFEYGDTTLFDHNGNRIGEIDWIEDDSNFELEYVCVDGEDDEADDEQ